MRLQSIDGWESNEEWKTAYDAIRAGECQDPCPGQRELVFVTYLEDYGDTDYRFYRSGKGDEEGTLIEGNAKSYCVNNADCNIMALLRTRYVYSFTMENNMLIDDKSSEYTMTFGNCASNCTDTTLLVATNQNDGNLNISSGSDLSQLTSEILPAGQSKTICIDDSKCSIVDAKGNGYYYLLRDEQVYDLGSASEYRYFGPCDTKCTKRPTLTATERGLEIVTRLSTISGMAALTDFNSDRYKAACWIINDDLKEYSAKDPKLIQRYILAVIYFTTGGQNNWISPLGFMSGRDECDWPSISCVDQSVTSLRLGMFSNFNHNFCF